MTVYYVSTRGNDSNTGTQNKPWQHIQYACGRLNPGDVLRILPGDYDENLLLCTNKNSIPRSIRQFATVVRPGTNQQKIMIQADDADDKPRITGSQRFGRFLAYDVSHWTIDGLCAENFEGSGIIFAALNSPQSGVTIRNCVLRNMWGGPGGGEIGNGIGRYGICIIGKNHKTFSNILIENNILDHIIPGDENDGNECLDVAGEIDGAVIQHNSLNECHRIAINVLGADGTARNLKINNGQPYNIIIRYNRITNMLEKANNKGPSKVGTPIYCDRAGENILIENNYMEQSNGWNSCTALQIGYEPGWADNTRDTRYVCIRNNVAVNCRLGYQLGFGSNSDNFDKEPDGVACVHNVIVQKQTQQGVFGFTFGRGVNFRIKNNVIANRVTKNACRTRDVLNYQGEKLGPQPEPSTWVINGNLWQLTNGQHWEWGPNKFYTSLDALREVGQETNGQLATPVFVNEENDDYRLALSSPGQGSAIPLTQAAEAGQNANVLHTEESLYFWSGDIIVINGVTAVVERVDRTTNSLYLDRGMSWQKGAGVYYQYFGDAPSVGLTATRSTVIPTVPPTTVEGMPRDVSVTAGADAVFAAEFTGINLSYQWYASDDTPLEDNEELMTGVTTDTLCLKTVSLAQDGFQYYCITSNSAGSIRSRIAQLTVNEENAEPDIYDRLIQKGLYAGVRSGTG